MNIEKQQKLYAERVKRLSPPSSFFKDLILSFFIGGVICTVGQLINFGYAAAELDKETAGACTSATMILIGSVLTGTGIYARIARFGKAGTLVPITGFANSIVSPAIEYRTEGYILGVGAKMFIIAGPVIVYGITASVTYGLIFLLMGVM